MPRRVVAILALCALAAPAPARIIPFPFTRSGGFRYLGGVSTVFTDNFQRANGDLAAAGNWSLLTGATNAATVASNALSYAGSGKTNPTIYAAPDPSSADQFSEQTIGTPLPANGGDFSGVRCSYNGSTVSYVAVVQRATVTAVSVVQFVNGTQSILATITIPAINSGDIVRLAASGNMAALFINGAQVGTAVTTTLTTGVPCIVIAGTNQSNVATNWRSGAGDGS